MAISLYSCIGSVRELPIFEEADHRPGTVVEDNVELLGNLGPIATPFAELKLDLRRSSRLVGSNIDPDSRPRAGKVKELGSESLRVSLSLKVSSC